VTLGAAEPSPRAPQHVARALRASVRQEETVTDEEIELRAQLRAIHVEIEAEAATRRPDASWLERARVRDARLLDLERRLARLRDEEHVDVGPHPELPFKAYGEVHVVHIGASIQVAVEERTTDADRPPILLLTFGPQHGLRVEHFDFTFLEQHPLYGRGLGLVGLFVVRKSAWKRQVGDTYASEPAYVPKNWAQVEHFLLRWKDGTIECLAAEVTVERVEISMQEVRRRLDGLAHLGRPTR
jgi:hypothetical protein